jgi:hypothetical protein
MLSPKLPACNNPAGRRQVQMEVAVGDPEKRGYYQGVDNKMDSAVAYFQSIGFREVARSCNGVSDWSICEEANIVFCREGRECSTDVS